jgi:FkbM family methyltransferase
LDIGGRIVSFEPVPDEFTKLRRAFENDRAWSGHPIALGKEPGTLRIKIPGLTVMSSFLDLQEHGK